MPLKKEILDLPFYTQHSVVNVAKRLIGKLLVTDIDGQQSVCRIVETEAYAGAQDRASHAYGDRRTGRTEVMYRLGGCAYVYLCYGIHRLFNVVTGAENTPHAVLIRAGAPVEGVEHMAARTGKAPSDPSIARGPGNLTKAMGITLQHNGLELIASELCIYSDGCPVEESQIVSATRVGVGYAAEDALLPYRFYLKGSPHVSKA